MPQSKSGVKGGAKGTSKSANGKGPDLGQRAPVPVAPDPYLIDQYKETNKRCRDFIAILLKRLSTYEEDVDKLEDAFTKKTELPKPKLKMTATGSQSYVMDEFSKLTEKHKALQNAFTAREQDLTTRNQELDKQLEKAKHELSRLLSEKKTKQIEKVQRDKSDPGKDRGTPDAGMMATIDDNLKRENSDLKATNENENDKLKENLQTYRDERKTLLMTCEQHTQDLEELRKENAVFKADIEKQTKEIEQLQREKSDPGKDRTTQDARMVATIEELKKANNDLKANKEEQKKRIEALQNEKAALEKTAVIEKTKKEEQLRKDKSDHTKDKKTNDPDMKAKIEILEGEIAALKQNKKTNDPDMKAKIEILEGEIAALKQNKEEQKERIEALQKEKAALEKAAVIPEKKTGRGKGDKSSSAEMITKLQNEIEGLRNRLSKMAGAQLVDNNPAIADLSDPNRPLSLGEKFSELYDNEWTDAMEELSNTIPNEKDVIQKLLGIVGDAYKFCRERSDQFMDKINSTLSGFSGELSSSENMPKEIAKTNKDYRKSLAVHVVNFLQKEFAKEAKKKTKTGKATAAYIERCVLVCWFMTVQDPKVVITMEAPKMFDEDRYKPYTKKGKHLEYLVWPVLHLHEGGPMIGKGVAQGKP